LGKNVSCCDRQRIYDSAFVYLTIQYPEQVEMSPVYRGQHMLNVMNKVEKIVRLVVCALSCPAEAITMKAEERKADENICTERKKCVDI
jgi:NADH-quinone oxidoreductase subunit I